MCLPLSLLYALSLSFPTFLPETPTAELINLAWCETQDGLAERLGGFLVPPNPRRATCSYTLLHMELLHLSVCVCEALNRGTTKPRTDLKTSS